MYKSQFWCGFNQPLMIRGDGSVVVGELSMNLALNIDIYKTIDGVTELWRRLYILHSK